MYLATCDKVVNSIDSPALIYTIKTGEPVEKIDNKTLLELLRLNLVKKVGDFKPVTELKING